MMKISWMIFTLLFSQHLFAAKLVFVVSSDVEEVSLSLDEVKLIYLKKKEHWKSGKKIRPIHKGMGSLGRGVFLTTYLNKSESGLTEYWILSRQKFGLTKPMQLESESMILHILATLPGCIGYVSEAFAGTEIFLEKIKEGRIRRIQTEMIVSE